MHTRLSSLNVSGGRQDLAVGSAEPGQFPQAEWMAACGLALPCYPELQGSDIEHVTTSLQQWYATMDRSNC